MSFLMIPSNHADFVDEAVVVDIFQSVKYFQKCLFQYYYTLATVLVTVLLANAIGHSASLSDAPSHENHIPCPAYRRPTPNPTSDVSSVSRYDGSFPL